MNRSLNLDPLRSSPTETPQTVIVVHQGLQYAGEVITADQWSDEWGQAPEGDTYFRIGLLRQRRRPSSPEIEDSRIAVCVPRRGALSARGRVGSQLSGIKDAQALYRTQADSLRDPIGAYLGRQQEELENRMMAEEGARYASGPNCVAY